MKDINVNSFKEWIDKAYPEIAIEECEDGMYFLSIAGCDGPSFTDKGVETDCVELPWDQHAKEIEWKAQNLLECEEAEVIDFREECDALLEVAKKVREKLRTYETPDPEENPKDLIKGTYPNGVEYYLLPFTEDNLDEINEIVENYFDNMVEDNGEEPRQTFMDFINE